MEKPVPTSGCICTFSVTRFPAAKASSTIGSGIYPPPSVELAPQFNIRVTSLQPGAVESELFEHISDKNYRAQMEQLKEKMTFLKADDVADSIPYVLQAPEHVNVAELFIMPPEQPW
ncbi:hypothetical protein ABR847_017495 [Enterobacter hormaechei]